MLIHLSQHALRHKRIGQLACTSQLPKVSGCGDYLQHFVLQFRLSAVCGTQIGRVVSELSAITRV